MAHFLSDAAPALGLDHTEGEAAQAAVKETGRKSFWANCQEIDSMFQGQDWIMCSEYTLVDPYALVFYGWGVRSEFPMKELSAYTADPRRLTKTYSL